MTPVLNSSNNVRNSLSNQIQRTRKPFLIGVAGGTASGKSTVCREIMAKLGQDCQRRVALIKQDSFYRQLSSDEISLAKKGRYNFDHPDAIDEHAMFQALRSISDGEPVKLPIHDYQENKAKSGEFHEVQSADVVLIEGVLIFYFPNVRDMFHMKLFVDTDSDTRLSRRVMRDVRGRGRPLEMVLDQYDQFVKPAFEEFCLPTKKYADMIIPRGADNEGTNITAMMLQSWMDCNADKTSGSVQAGRAGRTIGTDGHIQLAIDCFRVHPNQLVDFAEVITVPGLRHLLRNN